MKLLVFASTPPPLHGQGAMVRTLVDGLAAAAPGIELVHVDPRLSRDLADIGRWRFGKLTALAAACLRALAARLRHGPMLLYYVPAPAKRAALYRDWIVLALLRPVFSGVVFHWHGVGLGGWLATRANAFERALTHHLFDGADLSIVLAPELAADASAFSPRRLAVVPNGIADPADAAGACLVRPRPRAGQPPGTPREILFLGLGSREKGLFTTLDAVALAHAREPGSVRLTVAGGFASAVDETAFRRAAGALGSDVVRHVGPAGEDRKHALFTAADLLSFPTFYPHEGQPLVLIEALAHDLPVVTTRWRAIPALLPAGCAQVRFVAPGSAAQLAEAFRALRDAGPAEGRLRAHFLAHFTRERHLAALAAALALLDPDATRTRGDDAAPAAVV